ncbi:NlpC/P60 family protein [uncultured Bacteroides sp.]|uniref:C40 family peptidase n=1 Tax=uncultured Bacteroides sp. TaxID=162156 RepID=UPI002AAC029F|nr:NlpC/P60 family protein [uncultured Bacteroides sp.]
MKKYLYPLLTLVLLTGYLSSCGTKAPAFDYQALAKASVRLGININMEDNKQLYLEIAHWFGVPYLPKGMDEHGIDCSGFIYQVYKKIYKKELKRSTADELEKNCCLISRNRLKEGDLVFFSSKQSKGNVAHVGIYLKENKFAHASSSKGVIISSLKENYYIANWITGGRIME